MSTTYREMTLDDVSAALSLWETSEGIGLSASDSAESIGGFLRQNPGLSYVAMVENTLVGAVLCGHDGRRGYLHHLAVEKTHRREGIGRQLVHVCLNDLQKNGIMKCHLFIFTDNLEGIGFWHRIGWTQREDLAMMSTWISTNSHPPGRGKT